MYVAHIRGCVCDSSDSEKFDVLDLFGMLGWVGEDGEVIYSDEQI